MKKISFYVVLNYYLTITNNYCEMKFIEIQCPSYCKCDLYKNLRRATCRNQRLVVFESYLPKQTHLLDISFNQISELDEHVFLKQNIVELKLLNISHNKLSQIHMNAFIGLNKLKSLDLSYNALQYLLINWFRNLKLLQELYLSGNNFRHFSNQPIIVSKSLKVLDLSKCSISHLNSETFTKIINLEFLDISNNYLIQLNQAAIVSLKNLVQLVVANNSFSCNNIMTDLEKYCLKFNVKYDNPCKSNEINITKKLQKIVTENKLNSWIYDDNVEDTSIRIEICNNKTNNDDLLLIRIIKLSPTLSVLIIFVYGIAVGILIGCITQIKANKSKIKNNFKSNNRKEANENLMLAEWNVYESTPIAQRKLLKH